MKKFSMILVACLVGSLANASSGATKSRGIEACRAIEGFFNYNGQTLKKKDWFEFKGISSGKTCGLALTGWGGFLNVTVTGPNFRQDVLAAANICNDGRRASTTAEISKDGKTITVTAIGNDGERSHNYSVRFTATKQIDEVGAVSFQAGLRNAESHKAAACGEMTSGFFNDGNGATDHDFISEVDAEPGC